jgi:phosphoribosyl 1,2-cyclic phosphate phosphodiesterase
MLHEKIDALDAILFTHDHKDHTAGLDDVRAYNHLMQKPMQVYGEEYVLSTIKREFSYAFTEKKYPGVPEIELNTIDDRPFFIENLKIIPIRGVHFKLPVLGFRIGNLAYLTDMNQLPESERYKLKDLDVLIINALRIKTHVSHFNLEQALDIIKLSQPKQAYLTHISHKLGLYQDLIQQLPSKVLPAYDGLKITF